MNSLSKDLKSAGVLYKNDIASQTNVNFNAYQNISSIRPEAASNKSNPKSEYADLLSEGLFDPLDVCDAQIADVGSTEDSVKSSMLSKTSKKLSSYRDDGYVIKEKTKVNVTIIESKFKMCSENISDKPTSQEEKNTNSESKKRYACQTCNKVFGKNSHLKTHRLIHSGVKPYSCDVCSTSFIEKRNLSRHMLIHSGEKPHVCELCDKTFREKSHLIRHKLIHSGEKPYLCKLCGKEFRHKENLSHHLLLHTGEKPHMCQVCNKTFAHKSNLKQHVLTHSEELHLCLICNKQFKRKQSVTKHRCKPDIEPK